MHTVEELAEAVQKMRAAQTAYFCKRTGELLKLARSLESKVDRMLDDVLGPARLFDDRQVGD